MASFDLETLPPTKLLARCRSGLLSFRGPPTAPGESLSVHISPDEVFTGISGLRLAPEYSPDGNFVVFVMETGSPVRVHQCETGALISEIPCLDAQQIEFSPRATYIVTWTRPQKGHSETGAHGNLCVWNLITAELVASYSQKIMKRNIIQWTEDETLCFKIVTNEVQILDGANLAGGIIAKVYHKNLSTFKVSPVSSPATVALFTPESGGKHASVNLYQYTLGGEVSASVNARSMFSATEANFHWNSTGTVVLVHTHAEVDSSNTSYYGTTGTLISVCMSHKSRFA